MFDSIPQFVPQEVCLKCEGCCRFSEQESPWRPKAADEELNNARDRIDEKGFVKAVKNESSRNPCFKCVFLEESNSKCGVYDHRPFECRLYPVMLRQKADQIMVSIHLNCPYIQDQINTPELENFISQISDYFKNETVSQFIKDNLSIAGRYPACEDEFQNILTFDG